MSTTDSATGAAPGGATEPIHHTDGLDHTAQNLSTLNGDSENMASFNAMMADYKAANRELQAMNFAFKKLEGVVGLENRISQPKIG